MASNTGPGALGKFGPAANKYARGALYPFPFTNSSNSASTTPINFLMNPETIKEALPSGWVHTATPGQNDPTSSWVANGGRSVSFTLLLTKDISDFSVPSIPNVSTNVTNTTPTILGAIGAQLSGIPTKILQNIIPKQIANFTQGPSGDPSENIGTNPKTIANELTMIRSLRYGDIAKNGNYSVPPPLVKFQFYNFGGANALFISNKTLGNDGSGLEDAYWTVDNIEITTTKWSNNLDPLEAEVTLTITQFNDINITRSQILGSVKN